MENKITKVKKRDGTIVEFEESKIQNAIFKALTSTGQGDGKRAKKISNRVIQILNRRFKPEEIPEVEQIQDIVEEVLILEGLVETAKAYILYREQRRRIREATKFAEEAVDRIDSYLEKTDWEVQENANMAFSLQGLNHYGVSYIVKKYWLNKIYPKEIREANESGDLHIHNLDTLACYCQGWDLYDLLLKGFRGVPGKVESNPPKHFESALGQLVNFFYTLQGENAGAEAVSSFDTLLAPFIRYDRLNYLQVKQSVQEFLFNCAIPTRVGFQSLAANELVVIKHKGKIKFIEIGKLIDTEFEKNSHRVIEQYPQSYAIENYDDYYTLSFDSQGKAIWAKVKAFVRHKIPENSQFLKIRTNRGTARVSPAHSLFSFSKFDGKFNPKPISAQEVEIVKDYRYLNPKNHFIALASLVNSGKKEELDLVELIDEIPQLHKNVFVKINPTQTVKQIKENIFKEYQGFLPFWRNFGFRDKGIWQQWIENQSVRYDVWRRFSDLSPNAQFKLRNSDIWYSRILKGKDLENFVKLCAWYISEGHAGISLPFYLSQGKKQKGNYKEIISLLKEVNALGDVEKGKGFSAKGNEVDSVYKISAKGLLNEIISWNCGFYAFNKVIPSFIFELKPFYQKLFLETLLKGDALEYERYWDYSTTSAKLSASLSLLLAQNDYYFSVYFEEVSHKNENWRDQNIIRIYKEKNLKNKNRDKRYRVKDFEAKVCLKKEKFNYKNEFEYDISVDLLQENFVGGSGLLVFHNTPFTNITIDTKPSPVFAKQPVIIGGKPQKETYGEFQEEMDMLNQALYECMIEGDKNHRVFTFPIPTVSITKDFDWDNPVLNPMWEATAKYGVNYFANYIHSDMKPEDIRALCCRLLLDKRELYNRGGGGLFGSGALTGSIGVVTIGLPRIGYLSKTKKEFFERLARVMDLAKESLEIKRKVLENFIEKGLYPYSKFYLQGIKKMRGQYYANHFSTIGLVGMNEALLNFLGENIASKRGRRFALEVLDFMRDRLVKYQKETGNIYNLEQTPAESTAYRLALKDKAKYPDIITAGTKKVPFYTNSSQLPVNFTDDVFEALKLQDELTCKYTGGSVFHIFLGERLPNGEMVKKLVKKIFENFKLPYITLTPTFCYDEKTEILTENGWKRFSELGDDEKLMTANPETKELSYQRPLRKFKFPYQGTMIHFKSKTFDCMVTPNHRMFVSDKKAIMRDPKTGKFTKSTKIYYFVKAQDVSTVDRVPMTGYKWKGKKEEFFILPSVINKKTILSTEIRRLLDEHKNKTHTEIAALVNCSQSFVTMVKNEDRGIVENYSAIKIPMSSWLKFFGIWLAEGSVRGSKGGDATYKPEIVIKQKDIKTKNEIRAMLKELPFKFSETPKGFYIYNKQLWHYLTQFGNSRTKYIPTELKMLPPKMLQILLEWYLKGDGSKGTNYCCSFSKRLRDDLQEIYLKIGFDASISNKGIVTKRVHKYTYLKEIQHKVKYSGYVYCVEVPNHVIYVRRNGKPNFSGNSICPNHGYLEGEHFECPKCIIKQPCEVYTRIVGYLRPRSQFNLGKQQEASERKMFKIPKKL